MSTTKTNTENHRHEMPTTFQLAQLAAMLREQSTTATFNKGQPDLDEQVRRHKAIEGGGRARQPSPFDASVHMALRLWEAAERIRSQRSDAERQLGELRLGVLTLSAEEWSARVADYTGQAADIDTMLDTETVPAEKVKRALYRDRTLRSATRNALFYGLIGWSAKHAVRFTDGAGFGPPHTAEATCTHMKLRQYLTARECRCFVEAREAVHAVNRKRDIAPPRRFAVTRQRN